MAVKDWITRDTLLGMPFDDVFSYQTTKVVRIQDRTLGLTALVLKVLIVIFVSGFLFFHETGYLDYEPVVGTATGQLIGSVDGMNSTTLPYCQGETPCRFIDMYTIVAPDPEPMSIFVTTFMKEHRQKRVCETTADVCNRHSPFETVATHAYFVAGIERYDVLISQEAVATATYRKLRDERFRGSDNTMDGRLQAFRDDGSGRVKTTTIRDFAAGEPLMLDMNHILEAAGLSFDDKLPGYSDPIRETGVAINCFITYSNTWALFNPAPMLRYEVEFMPNMMQVHKRFEEPVGFGAERMLIERIGVRITFHQDGLIGHFSWLAVLRTLVIGSLLISMVYWLIDIAMVRLLPNGLKYEEAKFEYTENLYNLRQATLLDSDVVHMPKGGVYEYSLGEADGGPISGNRGGLGSGAKYGAVGQTDGTGGQRPPPMYPDGHGV